MTNMRKNNYLCPMVCVFQVPIKNQFIISL